MQIKVDKTTVSEDSLLLNAAKKKTVYKSVGFSKKESSGERMVFHVDNFTRCNCTQTGLQRQAKRLGQFLVMGHKSRDRYVLRFVMKIDRKSCEMKEALQAIKNANICKNSSKAINISDVEREKGGNGKVADALMTSKCRGKGSHQSTAKVRKVTQSANLTPRRPTISPLRPFTPGKQQKTPGARKTTLRTKGDKQRKPNGSKGPPTISTNLKPKGSKGSPTTSTNLKPRGSRAPPSTSTNFKPTKRSKQG